MKYTGKINNLCAVSYERQQGGNYERKKIKKSDSENR